MTTMHSPASGASRVAPPAPWRLGYILDDTAESAPGSTALIAGAQRRRISYAELAALVVDHCAALQRSGLRPGDVVALRSANSIEFVVALLAAARAGVVVAPVDPALPAAERRARADRVGARVTLTDAHVPDPKPPRHLDGLTDRDALIMFTSGSTGTPKLVPWTHDNIEAAIRGIAAAYRLSPSDATVAAMPLFHGHGLIATLLTTLATGGSIVLPARGKFSARTFWDDVATVDATWYTAVPTIHQILLDRPIDLPDSNRLRFVRSCSAPLSSATVQRMEATLGVPVLVGYGMTETTHQASSVLPSADRSTRLHTVGTPTGLAVRIVDNDGSTCPPAATGEIWLRGPTVVRGYLDNAAATASTFVDGWVRTGDLGSVGRDGTLTVTGRIKDLINRGGEKISPAHVEEVLMSFRGVAGAVVFGVPDDLYGERVAAVIVPHNGFHVEQSDLVSYCGDRLAPFEVPERIAFADHLPLTTKGSVDRIEVARRYGRETSPS